MRSEKIIKVEKHIVGNHGLHGELIISMIDKLPEGASSIAGTIIVRGETGNPHALEGDFVLMKKDEVIYFKVGTAGATLYHDATCGKPHAQVMLPEGAYMVGTQSEFDHIEQIKRAVID